MARRLNAGRVSRSEERQCSKRDSRQGYGRLPRALVVLLGGSVAFAVWWVSQEEPPSFKLREPKVTLTVEGGRAVFARFEDWREYGELEAEEIADRYTAESVPAILEVFQEEGQSTWTKAVIVFTLGKFKVAETVQPTVDFIESRLSDAMTREDRTAVWFGMCGLAFTGTEEALLHLKTFASKSYWEARAARPRLVLRNYERPEKTIDRLRESALAAFETADTRVALSVLKEMRHEPPEQWVYSLDRVEESVRKRIRGDHLAERERVTP